MQSLFSWLGKAANYAANTKLGKLALASKLNFLNEYLERPIEPEQISTDKEVLLLDLAFNASALNKQLEFSPILVSSLYVQRASFSYKVLSLALENVSLVLKWNPKMKQGEAKDGGEKLESEGVYVRGLTETLDSHFDLNSYLDSSHNDLMLRFINILLHKLSFNINGLLIALESPDQDQNIDILRLSTHSISLSKSDKLSHASAADLSFSDMKSQIVQKTLILKGPSRIELFSQSTSNLHPAFHLPSPLSPPSHPTLLLADELIQLNIQAIVHPTLDMSLHLHFPPLYAALHHTQLSPLSRILSHYQSCIANASPSHTSSAPRKPENIVSPSISAPLPLSPSLPPQKRLFDAEDTSDEEASDDDAYDEQNQAEYISPSSSSPPPPPDLPSLFRFTMVVPQLVFIYLPALHGAQEDFHFASPHSFLHARELAYYPYLRINISQLNFHTSPDAQTMSFGLAIDQSFKIHESERSHLPKCCDPMIPTSGEYIKSVLAVNPADEGEPAITIRQIKKDQSIHIQLGAVVLTLPLGLPKLISQALKDYSEAFTNKSVGNSSSAPNHSQPPPSSSHPSLQDEAALLMQGLQLTESMVFDQGTSSKIHLKLPSLVLNVEIPLPVDVRFTIPICRRERLVIQVEEIEMQLDTSDHLRSSPHAYRTASIFFTKAEAMMETDWYDQQVSQEVKKADFISMASHSALPPSNRSKKIPILALEGKSANELDMKLENVRLEWRDEPQCSLTPSEIKYAPYAVPTEEMGASQRAMNRLEFQNLASSQAQLLVQLTVHMSILHLSPGIYSFILDLFEEYGHVNAPQEAEGVQEAKTGCFVDFRSAFASLLLHVHPDPCTAPAPSLADASHRLLHEVHLENLRVLQATKFLGLEKTFLALEIDTLDLKPHVQSMRLARGEPLRHLAYAQCSEAHRDAQGHLHWETTYLVECRDLVVQYTFSDVWYLQIAAIFSYSQHTDYHRADYHLPSEIKDHAKRQKTTFIFTARNSSLALWAPHSSATAYTSNQTPNEESEEESARSSSLANDLSASMAPQLVTEPQLVLLWHHFSISIDLHTWLMHAFLDRAEILTILDRCAVKEPSRLSLASNPMTTARSYWLMRNHEHAGSIGLSTGTNIVSHGVSESSLKCSLQLDTSPSQVVTLQLLYELFMNSGGTSAANSQPEARRDFQHFPSKSADEGVLDLASHLPPDNKNRRHINDAEAHWCPSMARGGKVSDCIVSEDYSQHQAPLARLKTRFDLLPLDFVWRFREEGTKKGNEEQTLALYFKQLVARYEVDENDAMTLEVSFREVNGYSYMSGDRGMHFFGFDEKGGQYRPHHLSFHLKTCPQEMKSLKVDDWLDRSRYLATLAEDAKNCNFSKFASFRLVVLPMQLTFNVSTFPFIHSYCQTYSALYRVFHTSKTVEKEAGFVASFLEVIGSSLSVNPIQSTEEAEEKESVLEMAKRKQGVLRLSDAEIVVPSTKVERFYVSDLHLRLNLPGVEDAKIRLPCVIASDVGEWSEVVAELTSAYTPFLNEALGSVLVSFPGVKLARAVTVGLYRMVQIPMEEAKSGRSVGYGFAKALGSTVWDTATETVSLTAQAVGLAYRGLGAVGSLFDRRSDVESLQALDQHQHVPSPNDFLDGATQGLTSVKEGVSAAKHNLLAPIQRFQSDDGSFFVLVRDVPLSVGGAIIYPIAGVVKGANDILHGTVATMRADRTTQPPLPSSSPPTLPVFLSDES